MTNARFFIMCVVALVATSCATMHSSKQAEESFFGETNENTKKEWVRIRDAANKGEWKSTQSLAQQFVRKHPKSPLSPEAQFLIARSHYAQGQHQAARQTFTRFLEAHSGNFRANEARYGLALSMYRMGQMDQSAAVLSSVNISALPENDRFFAQFLNSKFAALQGRTYDSVLFALSAHDLLAQDNPLKKSLSEQVQRAIESQLSEPELQKLRSDRRGRFPEDLILYQLAKRAESDSHLEKARDYYDDLVEQFPDKKQESTVAQAIERLNPDEAIEARTIGVLLPLSGDFAPYGLSALRGIQLAAQIYSSDGKAPKYKLVIRDTKGNPELAREAFRELTEQQRVAAILGPLASKEAEFVAELAQQSHVPLFVLSQKTGLTEEDGYVFQSAMTLKLQAQTVAQEAYEHLGVRRFAILYPQDPYGIELATEFQREVEKRGAKVTAMESYPPGETDFRDQIKRLVGTYYPGARKEEYAKIKQSLTEERKDKNNKKPIEVNLPPIVDFEALFIPDGYKTVGQVAPFLEYFDVEGITLLGSNAWNSRQLIARGWPYVEGAVFVDGFFAESRSPAVSNFLTRYRNVYRTQPDIHAAQAFDAFSLVGQALSGLSQPTRPDVKRALLSLRDYEGVSGRVSRFLSNGEAEKKLFVLTPRDKRIVERSN